MRAFLHLSSAASIMIGALLLALPQTAQAQLNNQPFAFQRGGMTAGSVGMSPAYRQIILERKLSGRSTANSFIRGTDGTLVNVERTGDQAFARPTTAPYSAARSGLSWGGGGYSADVGTSPPRGALRNDPVNEDMPALFGGAAGGVPINSWIYQLATLPDLAS